MRKLCNPIPNKLLYQLINYLRCVGIGIVTGIFYQFEWNTSLFLCKNLLYSRHIFNRSFSPQINKAGQGIS